MPQDPNDEPAGVLLERIRAERELLRQNQGKYKTVKSTKNHSHPKKIVQIMANQIEIYQLADNQTNVEVRFEEDTVWLSQQQMALLFNQTKQNISLHINNCYKEGELDRAATVKDYLTVRTEGTRKVSRNIEYYNMDGECSQNCVTLHRSPPPSLHLKGRADSAKNQ